MALNELSRLAEAVGVAARAGRLRSLFKRVERAGLSERLVARLDDLRIPADLYERLGQRKTLAELVGRRGWERRVLWAGEEVLRRRASHRLGVERDDPLVVVRELFRLGEPARFAPIDWPLIYSLAGPNLRRSAAAGAALPPLWDRSWRLVYLIRLLGMGRSLPGQPFPFGRVPELPFRTLRSGDRISPGDLLAYEGFDPPPLSLVTRVAGPGIPSEVLIDSHGIPLLTHPHSLGEQFWPYRLDWNDGRREPFERIRLRWEPPTPEAVRAIAPFARGLSFDREPFLIKSIDFSRPFAGWPLSASYLLRNGDHLMVSFEPIGDRELQLRVTYTKFREATEEELLPVLERGFEALGRSQHLRRVVVGFHLVWDEEMERALPLRGYRKGELGSWGPGYWIKEFVTGL